MSDVLPETNKIEAIRELAGRTEENFDLEKKFEEKKLELIPRIQSMKFSQGNPESSQENPESS